MTRQEKNIIKEQKQKALAVQEMLKSDGWRIVDEEMASESNKLMNKLIKEEKIEKMRIIQADIKALHKLLNRIRSYNEIIVNKR